MKKLGAIIFIAALAVGLVLANVFSFGRISDRLFSFKFNSKVKGSGNVITERRELSGFKGIEVGGIFKVEAIAQSDYGVEVEVDDNLMQRVKTEVSGGVLHITFDGNLRSHGPILVRVTAPNIEKINASGAASVRLSNVSNESLTVDSSGASKITLSGTTNKLSVDISGATKVEAVDLKAVDAELEASGASSIDVFATGSLSADASGASKISYSGSPKNVDRNTSGASSITAH
jgi:hypothetical protein